MCKLLLCFSPLCSSIGRTAWSHGLEGACGSIVLLLVCFGSTEEGGEETGLDNRVNVKGLLSVICHSGACYFPGKSFDLADLCSRGLGSASLIAVMKQAGIFTEVTFHLNTCLLWGCSGCLPFSS